MFKIENLTTNHSSKYIRPQSKMPTLKGNSETTCSKSLPLKMMKLGPNEVDMSSMVGLIQRSVPWIIILPLSIRFCILLCVANGKAVFLLPTYSCPERAGTFFNSDIFRDWVRGRNRWNRVFKNSDPIVSKNIRVEERKK